MSVKFVRAAKQLNEGLEEQGYPGSADSLLRAAKAMDKSAYLGGTNLQAVTESLIRAEKMPALTEGAATLRTAGRRLQEAQKGLAQAASGSAGKLKALNGMHLSLLTLIPRIIHEYIR